VPGSRLGPWVMDYSGTLVFGRKRENPTAL
jgi:hypothetical protein